MKTSYNSKNLKTIFKILVCCVFAFISLFGMGLIINSQIDNRPAQATTLNTDTTKYKTLSANTISKKIKDRVDSYNENYYETITKIIFVDSIDDFPASDYSIRNYPTSQYTFTFDVSGIYAYKKGTTLYIYSAYAVKTSYTKTDGTIGYNTSYYLNQKMYAPTDCSTLINYSAKDTLTDNERKNTFSNLQEIDLGGLIFKGSGYTYPTTNMSYLFAYMPKLTKITYGDTFNTSEVTNMSYMFYGCKSLTSLDLSKFNTSKVTNMSNMFNLIYSDSNAAINEESLAKSDYSQSLTSLDLSGFNNSKVTNFSKIFNGIGGLTSLTLGSNFVTSAATDLSYMFQRCDSITSLDLSAFNTTNVTTMKNMFAFCEKVTSIKVGSNFKTSKVVDMSFMFRNCPKMTTFNGSSGYININDLDTSNVTTMEGLFFNCYGCSQFDITGLEYDNLQNIDSMFASTYLKDVDQITGIKEFNPLKVTSLFEFMGGWNLGRDFYTKKLADKNYFPLLYESRITDIGALFRHTNIFGEIESSTGKDLAYGNISAMFRKNGREFNSYSSIWALFYESNLSTLKGIEELDTSNATNFTYFFADTNITSLEGLSGLRVGAATNISLMFAKCANLGAGEIAVDSTKLAFANKNVSAFGLFRECSKLEDISVLGAFDFSNTASLNFEEAFAKTKLSTNVANKSFTLGGNVTLTRLLSSGTGTSLEALGALKIARVNYSYPKVDYMFENTTGLSNLNGLSKFFETNPGLYQIDNMFRNGGMTSLKDNTASGKYQFSTNLTIIDDLFADSKLQYTNGLSNFDFSNVTQANRLFKGCKDLVSTRDDNPRETLSKLQYAISAFEDCASLIRLDNLSTLINTETLISAEAMFKNDSGLYYTDGFLDGNKFAKLQNGAEMFYNCYLNSSSHGTFAEDVFPSLTNGSRMFYNGTSSSTSISPSLFEKTTFPSLTTGNYMFYKVTIGALSSNIKEDIFPKLTDGTYMFYNTGSIGSVIFTKTTFPALTNGTEMFYFANLGSLNSAKSGIFPKLSTGTYMFESSSLTDISGLKNTTFPALTTATGMFTRNSITNLDAFADDSFPKLTTANSMFSNNQFTSLAGLENQSFPEVTSASSMFSYNSKLTSLVGLKEGALPKNTSMSSMFYSCQALTTTEGIEKLDVSNVTSISSIFYDCKLLEDVTAFAKLNFTKNITSIQSAFSGCSALEEIDLSNIILSSSCSATNAFYDVDKLKVLHTPTIQGSVSITLPKTMHSIDGTFTGKTIKSTESAKQLSYLKLNVSYYTTCDTDGATATFDDSALTKTVYYTGEDQTIEIANAPTMEAHAFITWLFRKTATATAVENLDGIVFENGHVTIPNSAFASFTATDGEANLFIKASWREILYRVSLSVDNAGYAIFKNSSGTEITEIGVFEDNVTLEVTNETPTVDNDHLIATIKTGTYVYKAYINPEIFATGWLVNYNGFKINDQDITTLVLTENASLKFYISKDKEKYIITFNYIVKDSEGENLIGTPSLNGSETKAVYYSDLYGTLPTPTLKGYVFGGWFFDQGTFANQITESSVVDITSSQNVFAKWDIEIYTLVLSVNNDELAELETPNYTLTGIRYGTKVEASDTQIKVGQMVIKLKICDQYGYNINMLGWYISGLKIEEYTIEKDNVRIMASLEKVAKTIKVSLNLNTVDSDGEILIGTPSVSPAEFTVTYKQKYSQLNDASLEGYDFIGWFTGVNSGDNITADTEVTNVDSDLILYAKWQIHIHTIIFDVSDTNAGEVDTAKIENVRYGTAVAIDNANGKITIGGNTVTATAKPITGHTTAFVQWNEGATKLDISQITGDITITAVFSDEANKYIVHFIVGTLDSDNESLIGTPNLNGDSSQEFTYGMTYSLPSPTLTGYDFAGWFFDEKFTIEVKTGDTVAILAEQNAYAKWNIQKYTITVAVDNEVAGRVDKKEILNVKYHTALAVSGKTITLNGVAVVTASENDVPGYTITFNGFKQAGVNLADQNISGNIAITASFSQTANIYKITFNANGGKGVSGETAQDVVLSITFNEKFTTLNAFVYTYTGHNLVNWSTSQTALEGIYREVDTTYTYTTPSDITLYAYWHINSYTINFVVNDNTLGTIDRTQFVDISYGTQLSVSGNTLTVGDAGSVTATKKTITGYTITLVGFQLGGTNITNILLTNDLEITVLFKKEANKYTLHYVYKANDADSLPLIGEPLDVGESKEITFDSVYGELPSPTLKGYDFKGWFTSATFETGVSKNTKHTEATDKTIYAKWDIKNYKVTVTIDPSLALFTDGTSSIADNYNYGTTISVVGEKLTIRMRKASGDETKEIAFNRQTITGYDVNFINYILNNVAITSFALEKDVQIKANINKTPKTYTITFNLGTIDDYNEALIGSPSLNGSENQQVVYDSAYGKMPEPTLLGYTFAGWKLTDGTIVNSTAPVKITTDSTLTATWNINFHQVNVTVNSDDYGVLDNYLSQRFKYNALIKIDGAELSVLGEVVNASVTNKDGYTTVFKFYATNGVQLSTFNLGDEDVTIMAMFERTANKYKIIYNENTIDVDGEALIETPMLVGNKEREYTFDSMYNSLAEISMKGYDFGGWYFDEALSKRLQRTDVVKILTDTNVYAKWVIKKFTINASVENSELGKVINSTLTNIKYKTRVNVSGQNIWVNGATIMQASPTVIKGYTTEFVKWKNSNNADISSSFEIGQNMEITAIFHREANVYKITYFADGINLSFVEKDIKFDDEYGDFPTVSDREGYDKGAWYLDSTYQNKVISSTKMQTDENHTLYFKWIIQKYEVSFVIENEELGSLDKSILTGIEYNSLISANGNQINVGGQTVSGHPVAIVGYEVKVEWWKLDNEEITTTQLKKPSTIMVRFVKIPLTFTITYELKGKDANGDRISGNPKLEGEQTKVVTFDASYGDLPKPTLEGYVFAGWYFDDAFTRKVDETTIVKTPRDHKVYAKWIKTMSSSSINSVILISISIVVLVTIIGIIIAVARKKSKDKDYFDMGI